MPSLNTEKKIMNSKSSATQPNFPETEVQTSISQTENLCVTLQVYQVISLGNHFFKWCNFGNLHTLSSSLLPPPHLYIHSLCVQIRASKTCYEDIWLCCLFQCYPTICVQRILESENIYKQILGEQWFTKPTLGNTGVDKVTTERG